MTAERATFLDPIAPWAEIVPDAPYPMTVADLLDWPDDEYRYEVVEGVLVRMAGSRPKSGHITVRLQAQLTVYVEAHSLGQITGPDEPYDFERTGQPNTGLLPDIGFYYAAREALVDDARPYPFAPDLAVEVASPLQKADAVAAKVRRYLRAGTALVWVIWSDGRTVDVWHPDSLQRPTMTLTTADQLDGQSVIPGFSYPVARLFP